jgi:hypothetical protein
MRKFALLLVTVGLLRMASMVRAAEPVPFGQKLTIVAGKTTVIVNLPPEADNTKPQITLGVMQPKSQSGKPAGMILADDHFEAQGNVTLNLSVKSKA